MADVELGPETESPAGWSYEATVFSNGRVHHCVLSLSFQDYDLWCRGQHAPSRVAQAALAFFLERESSEGIPDRLDCATFRRTFPTIDSELPGQV